MDYTDHYESPLGGITLAGEGNALTGLWFDGQRFFGSGLSADHRPGSLPVFSEAKRWLDLYFSGDVPDFTPELHLRGTAFRKAVWNILLAIPYGRTMTYGEIARRLTEETGAGRISARAVGGAVGRNPVSLIVPCHRVVGTGGRLTGYAGGTAVNSRLLWLEGAAPDHLYFRDEDFRNPERKEEAEYTDGEEA